MENKKIIVIKFIIGILASVMLIFYASALFFNKFWVSGILTGIAAGVANPAAKFSNKWLKWIIVIGLIIVGVMLLPDAVENG